MNEQFEIEREIKKCRDALVERGKEIIKTTGIDKKDGLTATQIHNLLHAAWNRNTLLGIQRFAEEQIERSKPRIPDSIEQADGEAWKFGWKKTKSEETGKYFGNILIDELNSLIREIAENITDNSRIGYDRQGEVEMKLAREFLTYFAWYFIHLQAEEQEQRESDITSTRGGEAHV